MAVVIQAAHEYRDTALFVSHDAIPVDLDPGAVAEFGTVPPLEAGIETCAQPGRLVIAEPTVWADLLGDMTSLTPAMVRIAARHAAAVPAPPRGLAEFLAVCASRKLSLNKYVVGAGTKFLM